MKISTIPHPLNGSSYTFELLERSKVIHVIKNDQLAYTIKFDRMGHPFCNCMGARYGRQCWHVRQLTIAQVWRGQPVYEPWVEWSEEAGVMQYLKT